MFLTEEYQQSKLIEQLTSALQEREVRLHVDGMTGSLPAVAVAALASRLPTASQLVVVPDKEEAYYFCNDLEALMLGDPSDESSPQPSVGRGLKPMLFPTSYRKAYSYDPDQTDNANVLMRSEVMKELSSGAPLIVVSYPEALGEKVVSSNVLAADTLRLARGEQRDLWEVVERLQELGFEREDFVVDPGQYAVRGGILDVFGYASDLPFRVEFFDDTIDSLRTYDVATQLSVKQLDRVDIVPNLVGSGALAEGGTCPSAVSRERRVSLLEYFGSNDIVWCQGLMHSCQRMDALVEETRKAYDARLSDTAHPVAGTLPLPEELNCTAEEFLRPLLKMKIVEYHILRKQRAAAYHEQAVRLAHPKSRHLRRTGLSPDYCGRQRQPDETPGEDI